MSVTEDVVFLGDFGVHSLGDGSRIRISQAADDEVVSWRACELFSRSERDSDARGRRSVQIENSLRSIAEDPELTEGQGDRDGQDGDLDARSLAPLYSSPGRRFRELVCINKQSSDIAGGVHVGKDDLDVMFGYAGDETGETEVRILMVELDAGEQELEFHCVGRRRPRQDLLPVVLLLPGYERSEPRCRQ